MTNKKREINWKEVWLQVAEAMARHHAPLGVIQALDLIEWKKEDDKFILFCPVELYEWIEVPASAEQESNLRYIKPILWPSMQRLGCRTLIYKFI